MTKVYIAQLKCPSNHCVLAAAGEYESQEEAGILSYKLGQEFTRLTASGKLRHECAICKATDLNVQVAPTIFRTMEEAAPFLAESAIAQAESAAWLKGSRN